MYSREPFSVHSIKASLYIYIQCSPYTLNIYTDKLLTKRRTNRIYCGKLEKNKNQTSRCPTCWNQRSKYGLHTHLEKDIHRFDVDLYRQSVLVSVWFGVILQLNEIRFPSHLLSYVEKSTRKHLALFVHCAMEICLLSSPICRTRHGLEAFWQLSDENGDWSTILRAGLLASLSLYFTICMYRKNYYVTEEASKSQSQTF